LPANIDNRECDTFMASFWNWPSTSCSVSNRSKFPGRFRVRFRPKPDRGNGSYHTKNLDHWTWAGLPPKTRHFKFTMLPPIKYLSSDRIIPWLVHRLFSFSRSFTSRCQICERTNTHCVAIENPPIWRRISPYFTANQRILVRSQIWQREVNERLELHNLHIDHVMIRSELKYLIGAKNVGTAKWTHGPVPTRPKYTGFRSGPGNKSAKT